MGPRPTGTKPLPSRMRAALVPMARPRARWWACSTRSGGRGFHFGRPPRLIRPGPVLAFGGRHGIGEGVRRLFCFWGVFFFLLFFYGGGGNNTRNKKKFFGEAGAAPRVLVMPAVPGFAFITR